MDNSRHVAEELKKKQSSASNTAPGRQVEIRRLSDDELKELGDKSAVHGIPVASPVVFRRRARTTSSKMAARQARAR